MNLWFLKLSCLNSYRYAWGIPFRTKETFPIHLQTNSEAKGKCVKLEPWDFRYSVSRWSSKKWLCKSEHTQICLFRSTAPLAFDCARLLSLQPSKHQGLMQQVAWKKKKSALDLKCYIWVSDHDVTLSCHFFHRTITTLIWPHSGQHRDQHTWDAAVIPIWIEHY